LTMDTLRVYHDRMTKKLIRHGNSAALVLDKALLDLLKVQMDTPLEVTTDGKNIIISPQVNERAEATLLQALERINQKHGAVLSRLGK
jgi:antitoxin component of MazEF toxin-antitoxin module